MVFAQVPSQSVLVMPSNNDAKLILKKNVYAKSMKFWGKKFQYLDSNPQPHVC